MRSAWRRLSFNCYLTPLMSKKTRSQKAARKTKTADFEIFEDRSPQERGYLGFYTSITPRVLKNARESIQTGNMLDLERVFRSM